MPDRWPGEVAVPEQVIVSMTEIAGAAKEGLLALAVSTCVVALGIGIDGTKHPLGVEEGPAGNATVVTDLITGLWDRGLDTGVAGGPAVLPLSALGYRAGRGSNPPVAGLRGLDRVVIAG